MARARSSASRSALSAIRRGQLGGVSAAKHLQNILPGISGPIMGQPEIYLNGVGDAFDDKGHLTKESLQKVLQQYIDALCGFRRKAQQIGEGAAPKIVDTGFADADVKIEREP